MKPLPQPKAVELRWWNPATRQPGYARLNVLPGETVDGVVRRWMTANAVPTSVTVTEIW